MSFSAGDSGTINIQLQPMAQQYAVDLFNLTDANRDYLKQWLPWLNQVNSVEDTVRFIEVSLALKEQCGAPNYVILVDGVVAGVCGFHEINPLNRISSIGYWLAERFTGRGIMTAAVARLIDHGFNQLNLHKIEIHCAEGNAKSIAIAERLRFQYEATLRDREWLYDRFVNHRVYSLLDFEYQTLEWR